jgi:hypothetical protein
MEIRDEYMTLLMVRFVKGHPTKSSKSTMLDGFSSLFYGFELLKGSIYDQDEPPNGQFIMLMVDGMSFLQELTLDPIPPLGILLELQELTNHYIHLAWHISPSPSP